MEHEYKVGDLVVGTDRALSHRRGKIGTFDRYNKKGDAWIYWGEDTSSHYVRIDEIKPYIETQEYRIQQFANAVFDMLDEKIKEALAERDYDAVAALAQHGVQLTPKPTT